MITVTADPGRKLVHARMSGMLTVEEVRRFSDEEQAAVRAMGAGAGEFLLLVEAIDNQAQTREVMEAFRDLVLNSPVKARRIAIVRNGSLTRMQTRRIMKSRDGSEVFDSLADAEAWLFG